MIDLFLDDERDPKDHGFPEAIWFKNVRDMTIWLERNGLQGVRYISLDHDLGDDQPTGYDMVLILEEMILQDKHPAPKYMYCHSQNPPGRKRIVQALQNIYRDVP